MGTPFEDAGYTKDTVFRGLFDIFWGDGFTKGTLVTLHDDDGSTSPKFKSEDNKTAYLKLPEHTEGQQRERLEVVSTPSHKLITPEMLGEVGSDRYEVIRMVLKVLDGDEVKYDDCPYDRHTTVNAAADKLGDSIRSQGWDVGYTLQSEDEYLQKQLKEEKDRSKIEELEETIKKAQESITEAQEQIQELKG